MLIQTSRGKYTELSHIFLNSTVLKQELVGEACGLLEHKLGLQRNRGNEHFDLGNQRKIIDPNSLSIPMAILQPEAGGMPSVSLLGRDRGRICTGISGVHVMAVFYLNTQSVHQGKTSSK